MSFAMAPLACLGDVSLGKMLQTNAKAAGDVAKPYLRAAHVQPNGVLDWEVEEKQMWFSAAESQQLTLQHDDVVVVEGGAGFGRAARISEDLPKWGFQNSIVRVRPLAHSDGRFVSYALRAALSAGEIEVATSTATIPHFTAEKVGRFRVPFAALPEQRRIADYLDRETAEIDAMDAELDGTIALLRERRQVAASRLHSLGHDVRRLKWLMVEIDDRAGDRADLLPLLSVSIHHGVQLRDESTSHQAASADLGHYKVVMKGDIVLNRMRAFQGGLGVAPVDGLASPDYAVLRVDPDELSPAWAEYVMRSPEFVGAMAAVVRGIGSADQGNVRTPRINVADLFDLTIPFPVPEDQLQLIEELDEQTARIDDMIADTQRLKALLAERRSTLITDVVTGRKEVPA